MRTGLRWWPAAGVRAGGVRREPGQPGGRRGAVPELDGPDVTALFAGQGRVGRAVHGTHVRGKRQGQVHRRHSAQIFVSQLREPNG